MKNNYRNAVALAIVLCISSNAMGQSIAQTALYISDGSGHLTALTAPSGPGTISFPSGGGTLLTTANGILSVTGGGGVTASTVGGAVTLGSSIGGDASGSLDNLTLATVNSNVGSYTRASITVNAKGLVTAASSGPAINLNSADVTSTLPIGNGGTGITTAPSAAGQYLRATGSNTWGVSSIPAGDMPVFVASGASHAAGAVPDPGSSAGTTRYLREDATWVSPPVDISGGTSSANATASDSYCPSADANVKNATASVANGNVMIAARTGKIKNLYVAISAATGSNAKSWIYTLYDGATAGPTVTISGASVTSGSDLSTSLSVTAGDLITMTATSSGGPPAAGAAWSFQIQ